MTVERGRVRGPAPAVVCLPALPMRIVMLGPFGLHPKSTMLRRALPAARALARRGHAVTLVMPPWHTPAEAGRAWDDAVAGVRVEHVTLGGLAVPGAGHAIVAARMARRALALDPDVVHAFKPKAYAGLADAFLHAWRRLPGTASRSRTSAASGTPARVNPSSASGSTLAQAGAARRPALVVDTDDWEGPGGWNDLEPYSPAQRWVFARQERWGLRHADAVTVASRALETLAWAMGVPRGGVTYLPNAIDTSGARDAPGPGAAQAAIADRAGGLHAAQAEPGAPAARGTVDGPPAAAPRLLLYTRFFEFGLDRPLAVLARVRQDWPDARLVVAGRGLFGEETRFADLARARGLAEAVEMRGWVEPGAAAALFAAADIALYPFDDTLVNRTKSAFKLLELMDAGLPVVADAVGQNAEVVEDGRSGRLVPPGDDGAFAAAVADLAADPARCRAMGAAAHDRVRSAFAWDRRVGDLEAAYVRALGGDA